jgi:hypothetical protein
LDCDCDCHTDYWLLRQGAGKKKKKVGDPVGGSEYEKKLFDTAFFAKHFFVFLNFHR